MKTDKVEVPFLDNTQLTVTVTFKKEDFICPITQEFFFEPVQANNCEHHFEKEALNSWLSKRKTCPCCKQPTERSIRPSLIFRTVLIQLLNENPELHAQRHFSCTSFNHHLNNPNSDPDLFKTMVTFLMLDKLNVLNNPFNHQTQESITLWLAGSPHGRNLLSTNHALREKITEEGLNRLARINNTTNESALVWLMATHSGFQLLKNDPVLRKKITPEGLNTSMKTQQFGNTTALLYLIQIPDGCQLLQDDAELRSKITSEGLNAHAEIKIGSFSALSALCYYWKGHQLIINDVELRNKITAQGLNAFSKVEGFIEGPPLLDLTRQDACLQLLLSDPILRSKITPEGLNRCIDTEGSSALYFMTASRKCTQLFIDDAELRGKITSGGLNGCLKTTKSEGQSPLFHLVGSEKGTQLLVDDHELCSKITAKGLNTVVKEGTAAGECALWRLASTQKGRQLLLRDIELQSKITKEGLNATLKNGQSTLYFLASDPETRPFVLNKLKTLIRKDTLTHLITTDSGKLTSAADCLMEESPQGKDWVLSILNESNKPASFFTQKKEITRNPESIRKLFEH